MVRDYGMSSLGPVALGADHTAPFLRSAGVPEVRTYSEQTARLIDEEVNKLVSEALERARTVLRANREKVHALAGRLLATEVVDEDSMVPLMGPKVVPDHGSLHPEARQVVAAHPAGEQEGNAPTQHAEATLPDA
jgi:cell division protease FtsH